MMEIRFFILLCCGVCFLTRVQADELKGQVRNQGETFNFELAGQKNWDYDLKRIKEKSQTKIQLFLKTSDQNVISKISQIENPFVQSITVTKQPLDAKWLVEFTLKNDTTETFDYLTDQPSKLIIDFYVTDTLNSGLVSRPDPESVVRPKKLKPAKSAAAKDSASAAVARTPAQADFLKMEQAGGIETSPLLKNGISENSESLFSRFVIRDVEINEKSILRSDNNYYLKFPMLETEFPFWTMMKKNPPVYQFQETSGEENKQVQLLKTLFNKKRYLVFKQTADWFQKKFPNSKYQESVAYMTADAFAELWREEKNDKFFEMSQFSYLQALEKYPTSALAERSSLALGFLAIDKMDYMTAIRRFNNHIENKSFKSRISAEYASLGLGYSYSKINKLADANKIMDEIEKSSTNPLVQAEAAFRKADFYFSAQRYDDAVENYNSAANKYANLAHLFPNAQFNKMESHFWKRKYLEAHQSGLEFVQKYPSHQYAPYALTRVGELLDVLGAEQSRSIGTFLETYFRYGDSPKTVVARLHLLSTRMKIMKEEEVKKTIAKMEELSQKSELENIDQFKTTMIADGFSRRMDHEKAIEILSDFFQKNPNRADSKQVTKRITRNIFDQIKFFSDSGKHKEVLQTYQKFSDTWLKYRDRIDTDFFLGLAYENAGDFDVALEKYIKTYDSLQAIKGTEKEKWVLVTEDVPSEDSLNVRIADCYYQTKKFQEAYQRIEKVKMPHLLSEKDQVLRVQLASDLYEQKGDLETAMRYLSELVRVWDGKPELTVGALLDLATMQNKRNTPDEAQKSLEKILEIAETNKKVNPREVLQAANFSADLYLKENKVEDAAKRYTFILDRYEPTQDVSEERFKLGEIHFKKGELKKAENIWSKLKNPNTNVWSRISKNKLQEAQWNDDYKKYLKRIPAMSKIEGQQ